MSLDILGKNMLNNENNTDRLFRDKLLNHYVVPPPGVWNNVVSSMEAKKRKRRMIWMISVSSAASLLLAFLAGWYIAVKFTNEKNLQADVQQIKTVDPSQVVFSQPSAKHLDMQTDAHLFNSNERVQLAENVVSISGGTPQEKVYLTLLSPMKPLLLKVFKNTSNLEAMNSTGFSDSDRAIIAQNIEMRNKLSEEKKPSLWAVGVQASPVYRFEQANAAKTQELYLTSNSNSSKSSSNYLTNVSGGIKVELNTSSRFSVQSGVNYGKIAQNAGNVDVSYNGQNWVNDGTAVDTKKGFTTGSNGSSNNMTLKTQMGLANIAMPSGVNIASDNVKNNYSSEVTQNYGLKQQADYLEIPLLIRYKIIDDRIGFLLLGGINTNLLLSNNVSLANSQDVIAKGKIEGLNPLTFSSSVGMGVNYAITERFKLSLEPTMKIQLNSLNKQSGYDLKPYSVGVFTGISYQF